MDGTPYAVLLTDLNLMPDCEPRNALAAAGHVASVIPDDTGGRSPPMSSPPTQGRA